SMFRPGASYPRRTASAFSPRILPSDCVFSDLSQSWFSESLDVVLVSIGYLTCRIPQAFIELAVGAGDIATSGSAARRYTTAVVEGVPVPSIHEINTAQNIEIVKGLFAYQASRLREDETSCLFTAFHLRPLPHRISQEISYRNLRLIQAAKKALE